MKNVTCCDPASGSGTLLMALAHGIGENHCSIFSQDISQKSSSLLRLNLVLNKRVHSIAHITQGNTILHPVHKDAASPSRPRQFDYIVSNPPFKMDFSEFRDDLESNANTSRFFAGIPKVPAKAKNKMAIYLLFIQHTRRNASLTMAMSSFLGLRRLRSKSGPRDAEHSTSKSSMSRPRLIRRAFSTSSF